ncbi:hypothetical protein A7K91_20355 [Paenibacillus oryzae]|uniref:Uncharacterized protein n=1 Tax=Paenibacillus oryzae TaxID=1844972 RepID=A0A1A5YEI0_9BACL|nr:hypothetical protein [Paenibacillus oryzae]OBR64046.1 hypothetical protein A7K91_20355 [Paenibacillus oryzae]
MEHTIQLMENHLNIDLGNPPFMNLDNGLQIPYSSITGITTGSPIPNAFKIHGFSFLGKRNGLFRFDGDYHLYFFNNKVDTLHFDLNQFVVGKFIISKLIIEVKNPEEKSKTISERLT